MKSFWIAQLQTQQGSVWMSAPWDGRGILVVGHPKKWVIQKAQAAQKFTARWMGEMGGSGDVFSTKPVELSSSWTPLEAQTQLRLISLEAKAVPQFQSVSNDFESIQLERFEAEWLRKKSRVGAGSILALILALAFWPKPKVEVPAEIIPPQMAKIILKKRSQTQTASAAGGGSAAPSQKAPLSQAMKSASFQKSISKLLSSQGFRQLASSVPGQLPSLQKSGSLSGAPTTGGLSTGPALPGVQVAALGNVGVGGGIGYGKGGNATVGGQGTGQVLLDLESSFVEEGLTRDEVGKVIHSHIAEVRYCYESSMVHKPDVEGRINVSFSIGADGRVAMSSVHDSTVQDPRLDHCLLKRLNQWAFPKPKGGVTVAVTYPFIFKSLGR